MGHLRRQVQRWLVARREKHITFDGAVERVQRGAAYLDRVDPEWYRSVNAETLELSSGSACVLGQLHGEYRLGLSRSRLVDLSSAPLASLSPVSYGFQCVYGVPESVQARDYAYLNEAWQNEIRHRQLPDASHEWHAAEESSGDSGEISVMREVASGAQTTAV